MLTITDNQFQALTHTIDAALISRYKELLEADFPGYAGHTTRFNWDKYLMNVIRYLRSAGFEDTENYYAFMCLSVSHAELRNYEIPNWVNDFIKDFSKNETERMELLEAKLNGVLNER